MSLGIREIVVRTWTFVLLAALATGLTAVRHQEARAAADGRGGGHAGSRVAQVVREATRLDPGVHPAADPMLGTLWSLSHQLVMPVAGVDPRELIDSFRHWRGGDRWHKGIDIRAPAGAPVVAVTDGVIVRLAEHDSGGITLYQVAPDGRTTFYYAHLARYATGVRTGAVVRQGDVIGYVGDTGNAGPGNYHLHFEIATAPDRQRYWAGRPQNPYPLLKRARG